MHCRINITACFLVLILLSAGSCKKFLETKSVQTLSTADNLADLQLMLNNPILINGLNLINTGSDEYYVNYSDWLGEPEANKKMYNWDAENYYLNDWRSIYRSAFFANTVLLNVENINEPGKETLRNTIRGTALFIRAHCFYQLVQQYAVQYDPATAATDLGIVLRLNADFNEASTRASVKQTYEQILSDLQEAVRLLPASTLYKFLPGKAAGFALLARANLQINNYEKAKKYADSCLLIANNLIDYNSLSPTATAPMGDYTKNPEILYYIVNSACFNANSGAAKIDTQLYRMYDNINDLRKKIFFRSNTDGSFAFKGNYSGDFSLFNGIAIDEVYLIRAECNARLEDVNSAMQDLNTLLVKRWATSKFTAFSATSPQEALTLVLKERKKELVYRGLRWSDIKRLNKEPSFAITLKRNLNGKVYELLPNDLRYAALIPLEIMNITNIQQNPR